MQATGESAASRRGHDRPLRVTWLGHGAERTGPPIYLLRILEGLQSHPEIESRVMLLDGGPLLDQLGALAPTTVISKSELSGLRRASTAGLSRLGAHRTARSVGSRINRDRAPAEPDVVVVNTAGSIRAIQALAHPPRRLISHVHELATGLEFWLEPELLNQVIYRSDQIWVVADAVGTMLTDRYGVNPDRLRTHRGVLPMGADDALDRARRSEHRASMGLSPEDFLIGASGTLDWRKAPDHFLETAAQAIDRSPVPLHFVWIGGAPTTDWGRYIFDGARSLGIAGHIHHQREIDRPDQWFGALDLFVLPSREDAYPLVCLEAAAAQVPLVLFGSGGAVELVQDGGGIVVPYPDVASLAAAIVALASDPERRRAIGIAAKTAADRHQVAAAIPSLISDLQKVAWS